MTNVEKPVVVPEPSKLTSKQIRSRRNFLKWGVGGLVACPVGLMTYRSMPQRKSFTFCIKQMSNDILWRKQEYNANEFCGHLPKPMRFFIPDFLSVFNDSASLYFSTLGNDQEISFTIVGSARLANNKIIEGPVFTGQNKKTSSPKASQSPMGIVYPTILVQQQSYDVLFPTNLDLSMLNRIEWTINIV